MGVVAAVGLMLGLLRSELGVVFSLVASGIVGCGFGPWLAYRSMKRMESVSAAEADRVKHPGAYSTTLLAQSFLFSLAAWFVAAAIIGVVGVVLAKLLQATILP